MSETARRRAPAVGTGAGQWLALALFITVCLAVGGLGSFFTQSSVGSWYQELAKPSWTPPSAVFGPVWTALYVAMGTAAWLVWRDRGWSGARGPLGLFAVQLALNLVWSLLFFGMRAPGAAFAEIVILWAAILATLLAFRRVNRLAGWLFVPYLAWVTYASALNFAIWRMNP